MRPRLSLRARVTFAFAVLGSLLSVLLALLSARTAEIYLKRVETDVLQVESQRLVERLRENPEVEMPRSAHFDAYLQREGAAPVVSPELAALKPGVHSFDRIGRAERHVSVTDTPQGRLYVVLDLTDAIRRERRLLRDLIVLIVFGTGCAALLGWFWAGRAIAPVRHLAERVSALDPAQPMTPLTPEFARDELGLLAQAFDRYQIRLQNFIRREREFSADASHELRTPLAVIHGAAEVLAEDEVLDASAQRKVARIQRGAEEMSELVDALLALARNSGPLPPPAEPLDLTQLLRELVARRADVLEERNLRTTVTGPEPAPRPLRRDAIAAVVGAMLRMLTHSFSDGSLTLAVSPGALQMDFVPDHPLAGGASRVATTDTDDTRGDNSDGLGLIRHLCERLGWAAEFDHGEDGGCSCVMWFGA